MSHKLDTGTGPPPDMRDMIVQKCPACGEAMIAGGTCDICGYSEKPDFDYGKKTEGSR